jgi:hypothetical protein
MRYPNYTLDGLAAGRAAVGQHSRFEVGHLFRSKSAGHFD